MTENTRLGKGKIQPNGPDDYDVLRHLKLNVYVSGKLVEMPDNGSESLSPEPLRLTLKDNTKEILGLDYVPYRWPDIGKFESDSGFTIQEPWIGRMGKRGYAKELDAFERRIQVLGEYSEQWVEAECTLALVPDTQGKIFSAMVNGVILLDELRESASLRRRMLLKKMSIKVTLCNAKIYNRGQLADHGKRSFSVALDLKKFYQNWA